jgi:hypothetical protein
MTIAPVLAAPDTFTFASLVAWSPRWTTGFTQAA